MNESNYRTTIAITMETTEKVLSGISDRMGGF